MSVILNESWGKVCTYLPAPELSAMDLVSRRIHGTTKPGWQARALENHCPEKLPFSFSHKQFVVKIVPRMFGKAFHEAYFGRLPDPVPPIPARLVAASGERGRWVYLPSRLEVAHSTPEKRLLLDTTNTLVEDPAASTATVVAPMNLNNMGFIVANCLRQGHPTGFCAGAWSEVLRQNGTTPVQEGWYLLIDAVREKGNSYAAQKAVVEEGKRLKVSFLLERVWAEFCRFIQTGQAPALDPENNVVRTATVTRIGTRPHQTTLLWANAPGLSPRLCLRHDIGLNRVGVAVEVPAR